LPLEIQLGLYLVDVRTGAITRLAVFSPTSDFIDILPFYDQYQRSTTIWSPDSQHIVYSSVDPGGDEGIYVVHASGEGVPQRIASGTVAFWSWK
jgi:Tol biopolymer transport system component